MTERLRVNSNVITPNGPGVIDGALYENGETSIIVRHIVARMTHHDRGKWLTPLTDKSIQALVVYELKEVQAL